LVCPLLIESDEQNDTDDHSCRGCRITSRLVNFYPERVTAVAFLTVGYTPPDPGFDMSTVLAATKKTLGYELIGYWLFLAEEGADKIIESHVRPLTRLRRRLGTYRQ
jgi:hypothetical protein